MGERMQRPLGSWVGGCCGWAGGLAGRAHATVGWPGGCVRRSEAFGCWRRGRAKERRTTDRPRFEAGEIMGGWTPTHLPTQIHMHDPIENSPVFQCFSRGGSVPVFFPGASSTIWAAFSSRQWEFLGRSRFLMFSRSSVVHTADRIPKGVEMVFLFCSWLVLSFFVLLDILYNFATPPVPPKTFCEKVNRCPIMARLVRRCSC